MRRGRVVGLWLVLLGLAVAGCAAPQFTYVTNSSQHTYLAGAARPRSAERVRELTGTRG